jgi:hypothetical protein
MVKKYLPPHYIPFKTIFGYNTFRFLTFPIFISLSLFMVIIFGLDWHIVIFAIFALLFLWRDNEKEFFMHKEDLSEDIFEFIIWILILILTMIVFKPILSNLTI